jgi:hypothetical protein
VAAFTWIAWRFGPTLLRIAGWSWRWVGWACGSQGGYGYAVVFLVLGALAWGTGTVSYARRWGRWPSAVSARLFAHLPAPRSARTQIVAGRSHNAIPRPPAGGSSLHERD